ncbi:RluA family pseudouridine synthase [Ponticaulis sp.]|uniref:RluA family pseudouridine synthase n=1 Tax=Ponticaulis sp. TaxID=2020902 RepID=UPI000B67602E|nr:RluA family pseudouridine synthase [Ponticaulis sp.]MAI90079.1 RNA pseudouridine synthase [Ponticaulis sp.]OUX99735.1 MAG: RNA pseudouridine synthase [Hyphomonadaceae bacterium TMED5]|tara:strand:- start:37133 stop:38188 length:1056 start_codon:yes stop_codon:yes gene_type:complete
MPSTHTFTVEETDAGTRLDRWLASQVPELSRSRLKGLIDDGQVEPANGAKIDPKFKVSAGESYTLTLPDPEPATPEAEDIPLDVLFEDEHLIVIAKPCGMVVHPAPGAWSGTLVNALLHHCGDSLSGIGGVARPGIVHRLDKDTSGVMVVAKSEVAHTGLVARFQAHDMDRRYLAITRGAPRPLIGRIETRIDRSSSDRKKMEVVRESQRSASADWHEPDGDGYVERGKHAITNYTTLEGFGQLDEKSGLPAAAMVECRLETGRTHQIRVHMAHIGAPVIGDPVYGKHKGIKAFGEGEAFIEATSAARAFRRQALHAYILGFDHPVTGEALHFEQPPPDDMAELIAKLRAM